MNIDFSISNYFTALNEIFKSIDRLSIQSAVDIIIEKAEAGQKVITCGNGGSALTASHYITDWNKMTFLSTGKRFHGISLCDNLGLITAYGNDLDFTDIFSGQIANIMNEGDLLVAVSGSGNSPNMIKAVESAREIGGTILSVVGFDGGKLKTISDFCVCVPSNDMQLCEDVHLMFGHIVMKQICGDKIASFS